MQRRVIPLVVALIVLLTASCGSMPKIPIPGGGSAPSVAVPPGAADQPTPRAEAPSEDFPKRHQNFARHFTDPLYVDEGEELAPFGSDEGSDTLYGWQQRQAELSECTTVRWMIEQDDVAGALDDPANNGPDVDGFLIGAGFALILFTGHIDSEGKQIVLHALQRTYSSYAESNPREPAVMMRDLQAFAPTDCTEG